MPTKFSNGRTRQIYAFIRAHRHQSDVRLMCRVLEVTHSGYYAWLHQPQSNRAREDARLLQPIRASFAASNCIYGSPRVFLDLREAGETCSKHRAARLMRINKIRPGSRIQPPGTRCRDDGRSEATPEKDHHPFGSGNAVR